MKKKNKKQNMNVISMAVLDGQRPVDVIKSCNANGFVICVVDLFPMRVSTNEFSVDTNISY